MSGILRLESLTKGNTLKQGDKTPLKYRLFDADGEKLNIAGKSAVARLMYPDFLRVGYESEPLTVSSDNTVTFSIDKIIQPVLYYLEITVDGKYIFPSRNDESKLNIDKSSQGSDVAIIEIIGKDVLVRDIKNMVDSEIEPVVNDMIISNQKVIENEKIVKDVQVLSEQLEVRQSQVEQFNNQVITEMTDKDVISAPEIISARGEFDTVGGRLDDTAERLEQTATIDNGSDLQTLINEAGIGATVKLKKNQLYTIDKGLIPLDGQTIDLQGSTLKMSVTFDDTTSIENGGAPSLFTVKHKNIKIINGHLEGVMGLTGGAGTNCGVLVTTDSINEAKNTIIENIHVSNVRGFGFLVYGGTKNTVIKNSTANESFGLVGIEIWKNTMKVPRNVSISNVYGTNKHGIYVAGCDTLKIDNVNVNATQYTALILYGGDAVGNLINCKVDSSYFKTIGSSATFVMDGVVRTGHNLGEQMYVNAEISNSTFENTTSMIAEFKGKCRPKINNCDFINGGLGISVYDCDKSFQMKNSKVSNVRGSCMGIRDKAIIEDCVFENANLDSNDALGDIIYIYKGGSDSQIKNTILGKASGENGRYSINGEVSVTNLTLHDLTFNDRNKNIALSSVVKSTCSIINCTNQYNLTPPKIVLLNATPTFGTWRKGDIVINSSVTTGSPMGWQCTSSGSPGTWGVLANVQ